MTTRHLYLCAIGFNLALVFWGALLLAAGIDFGGALVAFGILCGSGATAGLRGSHGKD